MSKRGRAAAATIRSVHPLASVLHADGPDPQYAEQLALFGQFVGAWELDVTSYLDDGSRVSAQGEWHFGWVLGGRAVQDVWRVPGREYGTTVRFYDPALDAWRVVWSGPVVGRQVTFVARAEGDEIVLAGNEGGRDVRWIFSEIEQRSFRWRAVVADGGDWRKVQEMEVRRARCSRTSAGVCSTASRCSWPRAC
jgi:hypothetical protein